MRRLNCYLAAATGVGMRSCAAELGVMEAVRWTIVCQSARRRRASQEHLSQDVW